MTYPRGDEADWERRRRLRAVFGDVLPEDSSDDRDEHEDPRERRQAGDTDTWLREQVPPHHGGD